MRVGADYSAIARSYDVGRQLPCDAIEQWVTLIRDRGRLSPKSRYLDLGCGTGRFTVPVYRETKACVVGADLSLDMLRKAIEKPDADRVHWVQTDAGALAFRDDTFDCVFMSLLLHHVPDVNRVLQECRRVTRPGGVCLVRTTAHEQMEGMAVYRFFPAAWEIDRNRLLAIGVIEDGLLAAGFRRVRHERIAQRVVTCVEQFIEKMRCKNISALTMISEVEFAEGLAKVEQHFESLPPEQGLSEVEWEEMTLIVAEG